VKGQTEMLRGVCKWYDSRKFFGFVTGDDGRDYFLHQSILEKCGMTGIAEGVVVDFEIAPDRKNGKLRVDYIELVK
jgi:CspA family cold shock protein